MLGNRPPLAVSPTTPSRAELAKLSAAGLAHSEDAPDGSTVWWRDDVTPPA